MVARVVSNRVPQLLRPQLFISLAKSNYFTYVWAVENVNNFYRRPVKSPSFKVPLVNRQCCIKLCLQDKDDPGLMSLKLLRISGDRFVELNGMNYELSVLAPDGSCLIKREFFYSRDKTKHGFYVPRDEVLVQRKSAFLPNNTLTLQCKISLPKEVHCFARTRLRIEKVSLPCLIEDFGSSDKCLKYAKVVRSTFFRKSSICTQISCSSCCEEKLKVKLNAGTNYYEESDDESDDVESYDDESYDGESDEDKIHDDERNKGRYSEAIDCYTCKMCLTDTLGKEERILDETRFKFYNVHRDSSPHETISLPLTRNMLMEESSKYLTNGALSLNCHFTFYADASMNEIEFTKYGNSDRHEYSSKFFNKNKDEGASTLRDDLRSLYNDHILCDFTIQTETKLFSVHKSILISRSPIFRSMIMNCAKRDFYISDVDSETMHRFLLYLYTDKVEDMEWENALKLYVVAEQFKIPTLMKKCSLILTEKLTIRNVCDILLLAYKYHDEEMKSSIYYFISVHDVAIFNSDKWIKMEETNSSIAAETLRLSSFKKGSR
ncbi:hypothetical protein AVEN_228861-1 [Araneus ventricosus]|uniref:BTB domain-containing protein n=1 Tax=Araneus ventricosus TaxID=182803 RepID=A0A4Y2KWN5_ARAVE|nr:hypothetical protein AVEN_228861-1 [Araneus ventricosus]